MKIFLSAVLVLATAASAAAQAKPRPAACRYVVDVLNQAVAATTQDKVSCEYGGKILMTVNNLDNAKYRLHITDFKIDSADPSKCAAPMASAAPPINGNDGDNAFKFSLKAESTHTKKKNVKTLGAKSNECFKFDIVLYSADGKTLLNRLDPEIQITEPQPPPIPPPGSANPSRGGR
jgi:hypothetical protein